MNNAPIFDTVRPWLDSNGFNIPARVDALNGACDRFRANPSNAIIFEEVRPWLDRRGFTPERIAALNAACDQLRPAGSILGDMLQTASAGFDAGNDPAQVAGDDRYLPVFQRLASPKADPAVVKAMARSFAKHAPVYGQNKSKARIAEFVAQIANETGGFTAFEENLNYSAKRLRQVWPRYFPRNPLGGQVRAEAFARKPAAIANYVYQRAREGNVNPGDGWRYRGRGALQLTFRNNYRRFGQLLGLPLEEQPDLAADPATSVLIALEFYKQGNVNHYIDAGNFKAARGITNAGSPTYPNPHGLANVNRLRLLAMEVL